MPHARPARSNDDRSASRPSRPSSDRTSSDRQGSDRPSGNRPRRGGQRPSGPRPGFSPARPSLPADLVIPEAFKILGLCEPILRAVAATGYTEPTPIQAKAIPPVLEGRDLLGCAQTGTGKTAAFSLPLLHRLHTAETDKSRRGPVLPRALVLSPTRELASQIAESIDTYGIETGLRHAVIFGGVSQHHQVRRIQAGVDILVATPGRLMDLMEQGVADLSAVEIFVLDEADRMLDMGFIAPIRRIADTLTRDRQTLMFSATMPTSIQRLAHTLLKDPVKVAVTPVASAAPKIRQALYMVRQADKANLLRRLLVDTTVERAVVFMRTKHGAEHLSRRLLRDGVSAESIHGNKNQNQRQRALDAFRSGRSRVLVATDVAARGLDVDGVTHVFNFHLPHEPEAYIHRIGRTGRAGAEGVAVSFCDPEEREHLRAIERLIGTKMTPESLEGLPDLPITTAPADGYRDADRDLGDTIEDVRDKPRGSRGSYGSNGSRGSSAQRGNSSSRPQRSDQSSSNRVGSGVRPARADQAGAGQPGAGQGRPQKPRSDQPRTDQPRPERAAPHAMPGHAAQSSRKPPTARRNSRGQRPVSGN